MLISKITRSCTSTQRTLNVFCFVGQVSRFGATPSHASSSGHDVDDPYSGFNVQEYVVDPDEAPLPTQQTQQSQQPQATGIVIGARERNAPDRYTPSHYDRPPPLLGTTQFQLQPVGRRSVGECGAQGRMPIRVVGEATDSVWFVLCIAVCCSPCRASDLCFVCI